LSPLARWKHFSHESDMSGRGFESTLSDAFDQAALAMMAIVTDLNPMAPHR
jgi:tRNA nucleotidyltransferase (CCA-adding enzyme)